MTVKPNDIIDERKNNEKSCGMVVKVIEGGAGFQNMKCCGYTMGENDLVTEFTNKNDRPEAQKVKKGTIIDEGKNNQAPTDS